MDHPQTVSISTQDIRQAILAFLAQRLIDNSHYKAALSQLAKAEADNDSQLLSEAKQALQTIKQHFELEIWMEDATTRRIGWLIIATHLSKGIHPSAKGSNANYNTQNKPESSSWVSSATVDNLPLDASGAAALDIFGLLNLIIKDDISLLRLITENHPNVVAALSDDELKAVFYLNKFKQLLIDNWDIPQTSDLNKQLFWPNSEPACLAHLDNHYRQLIPLHPSSLCHVVYQKVKQRFSEQNKLARESRKKKTEQSQAYFSYKDLAVVKIGGSNSQNVSQLTGNKRGSNFLLPSLPPIFTVSNDYSIGKSQQTIFNRSLRYQMRFGLKMLFDMVDSFPNTVKQRDLRKDALDVITSLLLRIAEKIQTSMPAGWSQDYVLDWWQKCWLDPKRAELAEQDDFKLSYQSGEWRTMVKQQFAIWINAELRERFKHRKHEFSDSEFNEWYREIDNKTRASQRKREGIF